VEAVLAGALPAGDRLVEVAADERLLAEGDCELLALDRLEQ
jgi:hypothetical protein